MVTRARTPTISNYTIYGTTLEMVEHIKYLGVTFAKDLRWKTLWGNVRNASCATLRFLQRNLRVTSAATKTLGYTTIVRPQAEYACPVWSPHTAHDTHQIEMIQRTAARWVLVRHERRASVTDMLAELKWRSLEQRRADIALTMLYKIRNAHVQITPSHLTPVTGIAASAHPHHYVQYHTDTVVQYCTAPSTRKLWGCGTPYLLVSPWPHPLMLSSIGWARCATIPARPTTHPPWHPPCWGNFPGWVDGWVRGVPRGRGARPPLTWSPPPNSYYSPVPNKRSRYSYFFSNISSRYGAYYRRYYNLSFIYHTTLHYCRVLIYTSTRWFIKFHTRK